MYLVLLENEEKLMSEVGLRTYIQKHVVTIEEIDNAISKIKDTISLVALQDIGLIAKRIPIQFSLTHMLTKEVSVMTEEVFEMFLDALDTGDDKRMVEHFLFVTAFDMQGVLCNHEINLIIPEYDSIFFDVESKDDYYCCECEDTHDWEVNEEDIPRKDEALTDVWHFILDNAHEVRLFLEELENSVDEISDTLDRVNEDLDYFDEEIDELMETTLGMKIEIATLKFANKELESRNISILARLAALEAVIYSNPSKWPANVPYYVTTTAPDYVTINGNTTTGDLSNITYLASGTTDGSTAIASHSTSDVSIESDVSKLEKELQEIFARLNVKVSVTGTKQESK